MIDDKTFHAALDAIRSESFSDDWHIPVNVDGIWPNVAVDDVLNRLLTEYDKLLAENERLRRASFVEAAENDRLRGQIDSLVEAADAARLLLIFAAGPFRESAVPAMLAAAIERAKGAK